jgi:hypothetical protein
MLKGTADFFALNHYTSVMCRGAKFQNKSAIDWHYGSDNEIQSFKNASWLIGMTNEKAL